MICAICVTPQLVASTAALPIDKPLRNCCTQKPSRHFPWSIFSFNRNLKRLDDDINVWYKYIQKHHQRSYSAVLKLLAPEEYANTEDVVRMVCYVLWSRKHQLSIEWNSYTFNEMCAHQVVGDMSSYLDISTMMLRYNRINGSMPDHSHGYLEHATCVENI